MRSALAYLLPLGSAVLLLCCSDGERAPVARSTSPAAELPLASQADAILASARATFGETAVSASEDAELVEHDGVLAPRWREPGPASRPDVALPMRAAGSWSVGDRATGLTMVVTMIGARDVPAVRSGGWAVFPGALEQADVLHRVRPGGTEDLVVLARRPAEPKVDYQLSLGRRVAGLRLVAGVLELLDAGGAPRLRVATPALIDARRRAHPLALGVSGCQVDRNPAPPWGRAPVRPGASECRLSVRWDDGDVVYPALVDPLWTNASPLAVAHSHHTATTLADGRVLIAGGMDATLAITADAEVFDPPSATFAVVDAMPAPRRYHSATLLTGSSPLQDQVLIAGGQVAGGDPTSCLLFDPALGTWTSAASLGTARSVPVASESDGRVLVAGGSGAGSFSPLASAELFDPVSGSWSPVGPLGTARAAGSSITLAAQQDRVLVAGGIPVAYSTTATAEIFDPDTQAFTPTEFMSIGRAYFPLRALADGRVVAAGGMVDYGMSFEETVATATVDVYDPSAGSWTPGPSMASERYVHTMTLLDSGSMLVTGGRLGDDANTIVDTAELLDPGLVAWASTDPMLQQRAHHSASLLAGGAVLVVGGQANDVGLSTAQLFGAFQNGSGCTRALQCLSGFCDQGVCCNEACDGLCRGCTARLTGSAMDGVCGPIANGTDPEDECLDDGSPACEQNGQCDGAGACQLYRSSEACAPTSCRSNDECSSGFCVDGLCCDSACDGECESCLGADTASEDGHCSPIVSGTDPYDECGDDGSGSTDCSKILLCDGAGVCAASNDVCAPYTCLDADGCKSSCTVDADCLETHRCEGGSCVVRAPRCEGTSLVSADGVAEDCSPYTCDATGPACKTSCESAADCAPQFVCRADGSCVANPSAPTEDDDGCGCRVVGAPAPPARDTGVVLLLAAVAASAGRRRRSNRM